MLGWHEVPNRQIPYAIGNLPVDLPVPTYLRVPAVNHLIIYEVNQKEWWR